MIFYIPFFDNYARQSAAIIERRTSNTRYTVRNYYTRQPAAIPERIISDTRTACYNYFFQTCRNVIVVIIIRTRTEYVPEMRGSIPFCIFSYKRYGDTCQPAALQS